MKKNKKRRGFDRNELVRRLLARAGKTRRFKPIIMSRKERIRLRKTEKWIKKLIREMDEAHKRADKSNLRFGKAA